MTKRLGMKALAGLQLLVGCIFTFTFLHSLYGIRADADLYATHAWTGEHFWTEMGGRALSGLIGIGSFVEFRRTRRKLNVSPLK